MSLRPRTNINDPAIHVSRTSSNGSANSTDNAFFSAASSTSGVTAAGGGGVASSSSFETGTGFSVTSNGAIGFSQEIEKKLEAINMAVQMKEEEEQQQRLLAAQRSTGGAISCNRDAYAHIHITCASINANTATTTTTTAAAANNEEVETYHRTASSSSGAASPFDVYAHHDDDEEQQEEHTDAGYYDTSSSFMFGEENNTITTSARARRNNTAPRRQQNNNARTNVVTDPDALVFKTVQVLNRDKYFKDALQVQQIAREVIIPRLALEDFKEFVKHKDGSDYLVKNFAGLVDEIKKTVDATMKDASHKRSTSTLLQTITLATTSSTAATTPKTTPLEINDIFEVMVKYDDHFKSMLQQEADAKAQSQSDGGGTTAAPSKPEDLPSNNAVNVSCRALLKILENDVCREIQEEWPTMGFDIVTHTAYLRWLANLVFIKNQTTVDQNQVRKVQKKINCFQNVMLLYLKGCILVMLMRNLINHTVLDSSSKRTPFETKYKELNPKLQRLLAFSRNRKQKTTTRSALQEGQQQQQFNLGASAATTGNAIDLLSSSSYLGAGYDNGNENDEDEILLCQCEEPVPVRLANLRNDGNALVRYLQDRERLLKAANDNKKRIKEVKKQYKKMQEEHNKNKNKNKNNKNNKGDNNKKNNKNSRMHVAVINREAITAANAAANDDEYEGNEFSTMRSISSSFGGGAGRKQQLMAQDDSEEELF